MQQRNEASSEITPATIDASAPGITIATDVSSELEPTMVSDAFSRLVQRVHTDQGLLLRPLRLVLLTGQLNDAVIRWESALGLPEAGVSKQPEGIPGAKTMSWGSDEESARSIIILADAIAAALARDHPLGVPAVAHELGHVHDEYMRGLRLGFPKSHIPPGVDDWPRVRSLLATIAWSEYAAESVASPYMTADSLRESMLNDTVHLAGVHRRLRQFIWSYKRREHDLISLWSGALTSTSNLFANLGRAIARLPFSKHAPEAIAALLEPSGEAAGWKPAIQCLLHEFQTLGSMPYAEWPVGPFETLEEGIELGFQAVGLFPSYDGKLHVNVP